MDARRRRSGDAASSYVRRLQSTATANAEQTSLIRLLSSLPKRSVSVLTETLSTESRLTAD